MRENIVSVTTEDDRKLCDILIRMGILTNKTGERVQQRAIQLKRQFANVIQDLQLATDEELATATAELHNCKRVANPAKLNISSDLLSLIPVETAMQNCLFPLKLENGALAVAISDPSQTKALDQIAEKSNFKVFPFVSSKGEIHDAICRHYLGKERSRPEKRTVLIVEDDRTIRAIFTDILTEAGYRVIQARDGMEGFKSALAENPHVIITDMEMPKIDGYTFLSALRNIPETSYIPVIMVTGTARNEEEELKAFEKGFFDMILKPARKASLLARVNRAFHFYDNQYRLF